MAAPRRDAKDVPLLERDVRGASFQEAREGKGHGDSPGRAHSLQGFRDGPNRGGGFPAGARFRAHPRGHLPEFGLLRLPGGNPGEDGAAQECVVREPARGKKKGRQGRSVGKGVASRLPHLPFDRHGDRPRPFQGVRRQKSGGQHRHSCEKGKEPGHGQAGAGISAGPGHGVEYTARRTLPFCGFVPVSDPGVRTTLTCSPRKSEKSVVNPFIRVF